MSMRDDKKRIVNEMLRQNKRYIMSESYFSKSAVYNKKTGAIRPILKSGLVGRLYKTSSVNHEAYRIVKNAFDPDGNLKYENRAVTIEMLAFILGCKETDIEEDIARLANIMSTKTNVHLDSSLVSYIHNTINEKAEVNDIYGYKINRKRREKSNENEEV